MDIGQFIDLYNQQVLLLKSRPYGETDFLYFGSFRFLVNTIDLESKELQDFIIKNLVNNNVIIMK
jgi:hypothetical protein